MLRYINDQFNDKHLSTIQAAFMKKKLRIGGNSVELSIWDTAGQEKYHALSPIYYRGSNGAFLVYDITDTDSFQRVSFIFCHVFFTYCGKPVLKWSSFSPVGNFLSKKYGNYM